ncbi:unnamed protein product [Pedinophyceae sp. YPF-701]|nr:unnamed protein product [Pedinophyceae sp. YPF-701]
MAVAGGASSVWKAVAAKTAIISGGILALGYAAYKNQDALTEASFEVASASGPLIRLLDPETAHNLGIWFFKYGLAPIETRPDPPSLRTKVWGRDFTNPLGLAAGFDKNAECPETMLNMGFGFVEVGTITPQGQPGNPKPRMFRLADLGGVINRYGFNNEGADAAEARLAAVSELRRHSAFVNSVGPDDARLWINIGKNKTTEDAAADYCIGVEKLAKYADALVVNVSSPNTPGLRTLQDKKPLQDLIRRVKATRDSLQWGPRGPPPVLVKVAPDLVDDDKRNVASVLLAEGVDGLVVSNTTIERPPDVAAHQHGKEAGGLSGKPLFAMSTKVLGEMYQLTQGKIPLVGVGGVSSGADAYAKIRAGASLVELYTALAYEGPVLVPRIKRELAECLERDGFAAVGDAVGADFPAIKPSSGAPPTAGRTWFGRASAR